ncbi:MAG: hypothetical protein AVDCRST_MAG73-669, partial [uncultured Thermomicrobiales bacterium]
EPRATPGFPRRGFAGGAGAVWVSDARPRAGRSAAGSVAPGDALLVGMGLARRPRSGPVHGDGGVDRLLEGPSRAPPGHRAGGRPGHRTRTGPRRGRVGGRL